ncbi:MAG: glycosyltransferase [Salinivirgaceae bacterium]|nr:glycosyltransferase [Salinivirgaceae bacterium]
MKNRDIIITGLQSWDIQIGSNCKNIALEFSKHNRVLYVNSPLDRLSSFRKRNKKHPNESLVEIKENLWVYYPPSTIESISRLPVNFLFDMLNKHNNRLFAKDIQKAISKLGFSNYIHFCDSDMFRSFYLKDLLKPDFYIYYTRDNLLAVKYWQTQGNRIEPLHMAKADMLVANSTYLAKLASVYNPHSYFVGQGCDLSAFNPESIQIVPQDIASIPKPIIGYIGALKTLRLDIDAIEYIANSRPDWSIVLVGPEDDEFKASNLHNITNVYFLGSKEEKELPSYLNAFNLAINPQKVNEVTIGNYPRKIDEYLAMGKPVVATHTEAMEYFKDYVSLAKSKNDWLIAIDEELRIDNKYLQKQRIEFAKQHTWENNAKEIYKHFKNIKT